MNSSNFGRVALIATIVLSVGSTADAQSVISRYVIASGGGSVSAANHAVTSTIGQTWSGVFASATITVSTGFWIAGTPQMCYANCDSSTVPPILNVNDFQCFLNQFAAGNAYANCDGSSTAPVLNVNDFQCFLNKYAQGCP